MFVYLTLSFSLLTGVAYRYRTNELFFPHIRVVTSTSHPVYEVGLVTIGSSVFFTFYLFFLYTYSYYGHHLNSRPNHWVVMYVQLAFRLSSHAAPRTYSCCMFYCRWGAISAIVGIIAVVGVSIVAQTDVTAGIGVTTVLIMTTGLWGYKNWAANDFLFLRKKRIRVRRVTHRAAIRCLRSLVPECSGDQLVKDSGVFLTLVLVVGLIVGMGFYLQQRLGSEFARQ